MKSSVKKYSYKILIFFFGLSIIIISYLSWFLIISFMLLFFILLFIYGSFEYIKKIIKK